MSDRQARLRLASRATLVEEDTRKKLLGSIGLQRGENTLRAVREDVR